MNFFIKAFIEWLIGALETLTKLIIGLFENSSLLLKTSRDVFKLIVDYIRKLVFEFLKLFRKQRNTLINFFFCVVLLVKQLREFLVQPDVHLLIEHLHPLRSFFTNVMKV